jgi:hypothetical protein
MDRIGTSHIATVDFYMCGAAFLLIWHLRFPPKNTALSLAIALLSWGVVVTIPIVLILADINSGGAFELSTIALLLCVSLSKWHAARVKPEVSTEESEVA